MMQLKICYLKLQINGESFILDTSKEHLRDI